MIEKRINYRYGGDTMGGPNDKSKSGPGPDDRGSPEQNRNQRDIVASGGAGDNYYEKVDYVGPTVFGPTQKYTGSFLDNLFNRGYRNINPVTGDFQSRFSQAGGFGKSIFGGLISLLNPLAGMAYKIGTSLPSLKNYDTLADYARGEFGLFQKAPGGFNIHKGRGSDLRSLGIMEAVPPGMNLNDYEGYRDREYIESAPVINNGILDIIDYTDPYQGGTYN